MTAPIRGTGVDPRAGAPRDDRAEVRRLAHQLEGVFLNQMFQAMRASVLSDEPASAGEQTFTALFDERVADIAAERGTRGIGEALYRQLVRRMPDGEEGS